MQGSCVLGFHGRPGGKGPAGLTYRGVGAVPYEGQMVEELQEKVEELRALFGELKNASRVDEVAEEMMRAAHTIKGTASLAGFSKLSQAAHWVETLLELVKDGRLELDDEVRSLLEGFLDSIEDFVRSISIDGTEGSGSIEYLIAKATSLIAGRKGKGAPLPDFFRKRPVYRYTVKVTFDSISDKLPAWVFSLGRTLGSLGRILSSTPDIEGFLKKPEKGVNSFTLEVESWLDRENLRKRLAALEGVREVEVDEYGRERTEKKTYKVAVVFREEFPLKAARALLILKDLKNLGEVLSVSPSEEELREGILNAASEFEVSLLTDKKPEEIEAAVKRHPGLKDVRVAEGKVETQKPARHRPRPPMVSRREEKNLDRLMSLLEELFFVSDWTKEALKECKSPELGEVSKRLDELLSKMRGILFDMRTVSMRSIVEEFEPLVSRLAKELGKSVEMEVEGEDLRVDRRIAAALWEVLVHVLKNSVVHGIEKPEERRKAGKAPVGKITVRLLQKGDFVELVVTDDGRGIDPEEIKRRALERGLLTRERAEGLSDEQTLELIFLPGMSTQEVARENSGRGLGLNVVREVIRSLHGRIYVRSEVGKGASFIIQVPFELSIIPAYIVEVGGEEYAVSAIGVTGTISLNREEVRKVGAYITVLNGRPVPAVLLHDLVDFTAIPPEKLEGLVVETGGGSAVLLVDRIVEMRDVVVRPLRAILPRVERNIPYTGVTLLGGRKVVPVIDGVAVFDLVLGGEGK